MPLPPGYADRDMLRLETPAYRRGAALQEPLVTGNGVLGAAVHGGVRREVVTLTHCAFREEGERPNELPDVSSCLPIVRECLRDGRFDDAAAVYPDALRKHGYAPGGSGLRPLGNLLVDMVPEKPFRNYERTLNMRAAEIRVSWEDGKTTFERACFVSRVRDLCVLEIRRDGPRKISCSVSFAAGPQAADSPRRAEAEGAEPGVSVDGEFVCRGIPGRRGPAGDSGLVARVCPIGGRAVPGTAGVDVEGADRVLILVQAFVGERCEAAFDRIAAELSLLSADYHALFSPHGREHAKIFGRTSLDLSAAGRSASAGQLLAQAYRGRTPDALAEKLWAYGRYLLVCGSREGGNLCPSRGLWDAAGTGSDPGESPEDDPEMTHRLAMTGNLPELVLPAFDRVEAVAADLEANARRLFGCRGIVLPPVTAPQSGFPGDLSPPALCLTSEAGRLARRFYEYWQFTGDDRFLRSRAIPFMRRVALFYEDFLVRGEGGSVAVLPSVADRNTNPGTRSHTGGGVAVGRNATADLAVAREVFRTMADACGTAAAPAPDEADRYRMLDAAIGDYATDRNGAVPEWQDPELHDRDAYACDSHLYPVFPGSEIAEGDGKRTCKGFRKAAEKRLADGLRERSAGSLARLACVLARLGDGDAAMDCLDLLSRSCLRGNLAACRGDWREMALGGDDAPWTPSPAGNAGWTVALQEMMLYSRPGLVKILPALPSRWLRGSFTGLVACGGIDVSASWDMDAGRMVVTLAALEDCSFILRLPVVPVLMDHDPENVDLIPAKGGRQFWNCTLKCAVRAQLEIEFEPDAP